MEILRVRPPSAIAHSNRTVAEWKSAIHPTIALRQHSNRTVAEWKSAAPVEVPHLGLIQIGPLRNGNPGAVG